MVLFSEERKRSLLEFVQSRVALTRRNGDTCTRLFPIMEWTIRKGIRDYFFGSGPRPERFSRPATLSCRAVRIEIQRVCCTLAEGILSLPGLPFPARRTTDPDLAMVDQEIDSLFEPDSESALTAYLHLLHPADIAELFDHVSEENWPSITRHLSSERLAEVLANLDEEQLETIGQKLRVERLAEAVEHLETDDAADVLADLPDDKSEAILKRLPSEDRADIQSLLAFPEDSAGGIMQREVCKVRGDHCVRDAIEAVRKARDEMDDILEVYVVDEKGVLSGVVYLEDLVLSDENTPISRITHPVASRVTPFVDQEEVAQIFGKYDIATLPVVNEDGRLLGRITFDDIHDVVEEETTEDVLAMAGSSGEEFVYGNDFLKIAVFRLPWLISTLIGSLLTTMLVPLFSNVPGNTIVLASFIPVVMAMTGNVGSQTAMIITRGFAIGRVELHALGRTFYREVSVGIIMGFVAGIVVGIFAFLKIGTPILGAALGLSMICSMSSAALVGVTAPFVFKRLGIDPAIAAGPLVTMGCDVLGISTYLFMAYLVLS
jgi:magnesium transporter